MYSVRRQLPASVAFVSLLFLLAPFIANSAVPKELRVKAELVPKLAAFVTWPIESFESADDPIIIGILGEDIFGETLMARTLLNRKIGERKFRAAYFQSLDRLGPCHILFINLPGTQEVKEVLKQLADKPVLTVADSERFADLGGMIQFVKRRAKRREVHVALRINQGFGTIRGG